MSIQNVNMNEPNDNSVITKNNINQSNSITWWQYLAAFTGSLGIFITGMCWGWMGPAYLIFIGKSPPFSVTTAELSWTASLGSLSAIVGTIFVAFVVDKVGRKMLLLLAAVPYLIGWSLIYFSTNIMMINIARIINGIAYGQILSVTPMYIGEISSPAIRGRLSNFIGIQLKLGVLFAYCICSYVPFRTSSIIFATVPIIYFLAFFWMPESPYFYIIKNDELKAISTLRLLRGKKFDVEREIHIMTEFCNKSKEISKKLTIRTLFNVPVNRRALLISLSLFSIKLFSGVSALIIYVAVIFKDLNQPIGPKICNIIFGIVSLVTLFITGFLVDLVGRRKLMIISAISTSIGMFLVGIYFFLKYYRIVDVSNYSTIPTILLMSFPLTYGIGLNSLPMVYMSEVFAIEFKAIASSICICYASLVTFFVVKMYHVVQVHFGLHTNLFFFSFCTLIGTIFIYFYVPETKRERLEDIQVKLRSQ